MTEFERFIKLQRFFHVSVGARALPTNRNTILPIVINVYFCQQFLSLVLFASFEGNHETRSLLFGFVQFSIPLRTHTTYSQEQQSSIAINYNYMCV